VWAAPDFKFHTGITEISGPDKLDAQLFISHYGSNLAETLRFHRVERPVSGLPYMASPKHFNATETQNFNQI
jgi:hypothetical protein